MANTSSRTLRLLSLLQTHRFWPGGELAGRLEVSERTLRRDIERLRDLGYPVHSTRGVEGGYQLGPGGSMPPLVVDEDEAIAMVVALGGTASACPAGSSRGVALGAVQGGAGAARPAAAPGRGAARATVDAPFSQAPEVEAGVLAIVAQAIRDHERLRYAYTAQGRQRTRRGAAPPRRAPPAVTVGRKLVPARLRPRPPGLALVPARPAARPRRHPGGLPASRHPRRRRRGVRPAGLAGRARRSASRSRSPPPRSTYAAGSAPGRGSSTTARSTAPGRGSRSRRTTCAGPSSGSATSTRR